jgi:hypothetical protein
MRRGLVESWWDEGFFIVMSVRRAGPLNNAVRYTYILLTSICVGRLHWYSND